MKYDYTINGMPFTWTGLIKEAKSFGYDSSNGILTTSEAANYLRERGFVIEHYREEVDE